MPHNCGFDALMTLFVLTRANPILLLMVNRFFLDDHEVASQPQLQQVFSVLVVDPLVVWLLSVLDRRQLLVCLV